MAEMTDQGVTGQSRLRKFPKTIPSLHLSIPKSPSIENTNLLNSGDISALSQCRIKDDLTADVVLQRRGSGSVLSWTNPLESSANPVIISTHPSTPRGENHVTRSVSDSPKREDLLEQTVLPQNISNLISPVKPSSCGTENRVCVGEDDLSLTSVPETPGASRASLAYDPFVVESSGTQLSCKDCEPVDPVITILLRILQQLEQERQAENERMRREKQHYLDTLQRQRRPRARQRETTENSDNYVPAVGIKIQSDVLRRMKIKMERTKSLGLEMKQDIAQTDGYKNMADRLKTVTKSDIVLPEHADWLFDQSSHEKVWCVVADFLFCVFENEISELPKTVIILPGCKVRSLVYHTPSAESNGKSKTVSGLDRYQIVIEENSTRKKHLYSVDSNSEIQKWMKFLKPATKLDNSVEYEPSRDDIRRHSLCGPLPSRKESKDEKVGDENDTPSQTNHSSRLTNGTESYSQERKSSTSNLQLDSVGEFRRKLRRETDNEILKPQPIKATHFQQSLVVQKKPGALKKLRSFGSLDNLFKRRNSKETPDSQSLEGSEEGSVCPSVNSNIDFNSETSDDLHRPRNRRLSRSLDFGKSEKGLSKGLFRTASDLKERLKKSKTESQVKLINLNDIRMSGYLQQKFLLKWQKLWCVVSRGCLYGFRSQSPEEIASMAVVLTNCAITYVSDQDKRFRKLFVFKLSQHNKKSVYLNACDDTDLSNWLQCLQMEACKVQIDVESKDSIETCDSAYSSSVSTHSRSSPTSPRKEETSWVPQLGEYHTDNSVSDSPRRYSYPTWTEFKGDLYESDDMSSCNDDTGNYVFDNRNSIGFPVNDFPEHDQALKHVWEKDRNYLFNLVRAKLRSYKKRRESNTDLQGSSHEGLMLVTDEKLNLGKRRENGGSRQVKRAHSFNIKPASISVDDVMTTQTEVQKSSPTTSPRRAKRQKPLVVKKLAARDIEEPVLIGYLERRSFSEQWMRYWYVLQGSSLFCYLTPEDNVTVDILDLQGYNVQCLIDQFRGKRFVLELIHVDIVSTYLSADSRDEMEEWEHFIKAASGQPASLQASESPVLQDNSRTEETYEDKCVSVKKKLLQEMLRQKYELEKKQAARLRRSGVGIPSYDGALSSEEMQISYATNLRQRRLSTQIKMDTIQKQIQETTPSSKRFFNFGGKKKVHQKDVQHLEGQLKELSTKLQEIDQDLTCRINSSTGESVDVNQNRKSNVIKTLSEPKDLHICDDQTSSEATHDTDINRTNSLKIKSRVNRLADRNSKSVKNKSKTLNGSSRSNGIALVTTKDSQADSRMMDLNSFTTPNGKVSYDDKDDDSSLNSDSLTDLTSNKSPGSDSVFDLPVVNGSNHLKTRNKGSNSLSDNCTPRKEVHPDIMAEIDAFEDFTKQVLSARKAPA